MCAGCSADMGLGGRKLLLLRRDPLWEQVAGDKFQPRLHHVVPHFLRTLFLVEKCHRPFMADATALFVSQTHEVKECDLSDHAISVPLLRHSACSTCEIAPNS